MDKDSWVKKCMEIVGHRERRMDKDSRVKKCREIVGHQEEVGHKKDLGR